MRKMRRRMWSRRDGESGQGMVEYGLVIGLVSVWVVSIFLALRPMFTEQFALSRVEAMGGEGRAAIAMELGVSMTGVYHDFNNDGVRDDF